MTRNTPTQLLGHLEQRLIRNRRRISRGSDTPADIHSMRVTCRKLEAVLALQGLEQSKLYRSTRKLTRRLGVVRDLDVQIERCHENSPGTKPRNAKWHFMGADSYRSRLQRQRNRAAQNLRHQLRRKGGTRLLTRLGEHRRKQLGDRLAPTVVRQKLHNQVLDFWKLAGTLTTNSPNKKFHRVRIKCKQLRYLIAAAAAVGSTVPKRTRKQLRELQLLFGELQDAAVHQKLLCQYATSLPLTPANRHQLLHIGGALERLQRTQSATRTIAVRLCRSLHT